MTKEETASLIDALIEVEKELAIHKTGFICLELFVQFTKQGLTIEEFEFCEQMSWFEKQMPSKTVNSEFYNEELHADEFRHEALEHAWFCSEEWQERIRLVKHLIKKLKNGEE